MKAVKRFNPEVGVRLVSFAVHWIAEIHEFILRNWRIVKVATAEAQLFSPQPEEKTGLGVSGRATAIAEDLGVGIKRYLRWKAV